METKLTKKEAQNWLKCMFATYTTRDVIAQLADLGFKVFYSHVRSDMRSKLGIVETQTCSRCNNISKQCHLCSEIGIRIWDNHRFKKASLKGPSWSNTDSTKWCVDPWELAKCYMPPTGYRDKPNAESTDFNGIIGAIYNCTWMQCYFADDLNKDSNICAEAREEVNKLRHLQDTNIDDGAMISFFDCLLNLLNDPGHLHSLKPAVDARLYLKQLQQDTLQLSEKAVNSTLNKLYEDQKEEFRERLIELYSTTKKTVSVSPLREGLDKPIWDVYVKPKMSHVTIDKDGSRKKTDNAVHQYKDLFYTDKKLNSRVFIQGEPGVGKTTFLTKLALDWCDAVSVHNPDHKATFIDVDTLMEFQFLFYISLRDANDQREVTEMIKIQIIDMIYTGDKREEVVKLLSQIMEQETCLITMDGLNEWVDPLNKCVIPLLVPCHTKSVSVITSRSWKMADERIKDSEIKNLIEIEGIIDSEDLSKKIINSLQTSNVKTHTEFIVYVHERRLWHLFTSPWLQTLLVNLWMNNMPVSGSLCEINCILIDMLFKNAHAKKGYFKKGNSFRCLLNTRFIHQQINIFDALANAAFQFTFSSNKSLVFTERELLNYMTEDQLSFCLNAGVLTQRYSSAVPYQFSFIHETVQEFMAAYHIANSKNDLITHFRSGAKYYVLQISQTIIYLCGLNCEKANKLIKHLEDDDLQNSINHGLSEYVKGIYPQIFFGIDDEDLTDNDSFCLALAALFQDMIIAGYIEAKTNGEKNICLNCTDFIFNPYLNESNSTALKLLLLANNSNVRSLILESNVLKTSEIITIIQKSRHCLKRVRMAGNPETNKALYQTSIQELQISGEFDAPSLPGVSTEKIIYRRCPSLSQLAYLTLSYCTLSKDIVLPDTIHSITLVHCSCSSAFLQRLLVRLSYLKPYVHVVLVNMDVTDSETHQFQRELLSSDLTNIHLNVVYASRELCKLIQCTSIGILGISGLDTAGSDSSVLEIVHTLNRLSELRLCGTNTGRCDLKLPASLQSIILRDVECSTEWLCSLLITLSSFDHPVTCEMWEVVLKSSEQIHGEESLTHISDLRSEILSLELSNIQLRVVTGSKELFEILRDTSIDILYLRTADCVSLASEILHTLNKLTNLLLWGTYTGRCDLRFPASLKYITLQEGDYSSDWLCSLLITLSSFDHPVTCNLLGNVLESSEETRGEESLTHISDLRSEILSLDLSNIGLSVETGSKELFEILRDTSIDILYLRTADCVSLASEILHTLNKLTKLFLWGTYTGRCDLRLPASLKYISLQEGIYSSDWLCSLLITLSSFDHPVKCHLLGNVLELSEETCEEESLTHISDLRAEILSRDLSNITISVETGSKELYEILRYTSIDILDLLTADWVSLASEILHTLNRLTKLFLWGTYTGRCDLRLPASLEYISMQEGEYSSDWLCSLLITLSSFDHPVTCHLWGNLSESSEETCGEKSLTHISDLRSEILLIDLSNIALSVETGSKELFEILRDTSIGILDLRTADCVSLASEILHTLITLTSLDLWGIYTGRCYLKLPASLRRIGLQELKCSSEWLCSLLITLSSFDHPFTIDMWGDVLLSSEETCGVLSHTYVSDLRSEILSHDMSNIEIRMESGSKELFEILRDSSIGILDMRTAYCASFASNILHTLNTLTTLNLCGTYTGRCDLKLPASLQRIRLQDVEWSIEWLCSLLITLFSLDYPVKCEMRDDVFLSSGDVSHTHVSDLRSEILSLDLSNIEIIVTNGSKELFNLLRDTSIGSLLIAAEDYCSLGTFMLTQLNKLKQINLVGTYLTRFDYDLPLSLELMILYECKYSLESLYTILIKLSSIKHNVKLDVSNCSVISGQEACPPSSKDNLLKWEYSKSVKTGVNERLYTNVSDLQSRMMSINMSNIELRILNFQKEQFEILRCTNIKSVHLTAFDDVSLTFVTQNTLPAFKEIRLQGTYLTGFYHKLPPTLQYMILEKGYCSSDWLYSLMIQLSKIGHLVEVLLNEYQVLQRRESIRTDSEPPMRGADLSNVKLNVLKDCPGFYETLPTIHITSLIMTKIEHADMLSQTLPLLTHLQKLRICLEKCDMEIKLPACIKYLFIIYKTWSPPSLQHFVHNMSIIKHSLQCKLLFRVEENEHDYTRIKQEYSELKSVDVQKFEVINKRGSVRGAAAFTLSATADDDDDDDDRRLLSSEGLFVDSKPWIHYGKVRLNISCQDKSGCSS